MAAAAALYVNSTLTVAFKQTSEEFSTSERRVTAALTV